MDLTTSLRLHKCLGHHQKDRKRPHLIAKYKMKCFWCGCALERETLTIDHYIPLSRGGSNKIKNLRLACNGCNQKRGNAMPESTPEIIAERSRLSFPCHWKCPKYSLGQRMKQGQIVGVEYHPPGTRMARELGEFWTYWLLSNDQSDDMETFSEIKLQPFAQEELLDEIQIQEALMKACLGNIAVLSEQLTEVTQS